jgi:hypothetical protein
VLAALAAHVLRVEPRPDGYALVLATTDPALDAAVAAIRVERHCCPFLRFELAVAPGEGPVELRLTGPPGTREFLATRLEPARSERKGH